jgi:hypothetical protein
LEEKLKLVCGIIIINGEREGMKQQTTTKREKEKLPFSEMMMMMMRLYAHKSQSINIFATIR